MLERGSTTEEEIKMNRGKIEAMRGEVTDEEDLADASEAQDVRKELFKDCADDDGDDGDFLAPSDDENPGPSSRIQRRSGRTKRKSQKALDMDEDDDEDISTSQNKGKGISQRTKQETLQLIKEQYEAKRKRFLAVPKVPNNTPLSLVSPPSSQHISVTQESDSEMNEVLFYFQCLFLD